MKKSLIPAALLVLCAAMAVAAQESRPNLSGTWNLDASRSDFGPMPPPDSIVLVVAHKDPALKVTSTQKVEQATLTNERNLTTDGKPNTNKLRSLDGEQDVVSTSRWNGAALVTTFKMQSQGIALDMKDTWTLSADGKTLTVSRGIATPQGDELTIRMVYTKQQ